MRLVLYFLLFFSFSLQAQVRFEPLTENPRLQGARDSRQLSQRGPYDPEEVRWLHVLEGSSGTICLDTFRDFRLFDTLIDNQCAVLQAGSLSISGICIQYTANAVSEDRLDSACFSVRSVLGDDKPLKVYFMVRKPRSLPFIEDFSSGGPYPNPVNWLDPYVFVNNTMTRNPPTIGVATFDGLNEDGKPYGGQSGPSDTLTSTFFNLAGLGNPDQVYLSFFAQPRGLGPALTSKDSLVVQFRTEAGDWSSAYRIPWPGNMGLDSVPPFSFHKVPVFNTGNIKVLHGQFQFRLINYGSRRGADGMWNVDYIRLAKGEPDSNNLDVAFSTPPSPMLYPYSAMPWKHFRGFEEQELRKNGGQFNLQIGINNLFTQTLTAEPSTLNITEQTTGTPVISNFTLLEVPPLTPENQRDLNPGYYRFERNFAMSSVLPALQNNFGNAGNYAFKTEYAFAQAQEQASGVPQLAANNFASYLTRFENEFAYDDGTAEYHLIAVSDQNSPSQVAVHFHANVADTIQGIRMHIPHVKADVSKQFFNLKIWIGQLDEEPEYNALLSRPYYADTYYDTLQGFTTYKLEDQQSKELTPLAIPAGDFYVGWQQVTVMPENEIPIGYDRNSSGGFGEIWLDRDGVWSKLEALLPKFSGSLMLRPVMGSEAPGATAVRELHAGKLNVSPNPGKDLFRIELPEGLSSSAHMQVFNLTGQLIWQGSAREQLHLDGQAAGLYQLLLRDPGQGLWQAKILLLP